MALGGQVALWEHSADGEGFLLLGGFLRPVGSTVLLARVLPFSRAGVLSSLRSATVDGCILGLLRLVLDEKGGSLIERLLVEVEGATWICDHRPFAQGQ